MDAAVRAQAEELERFGFRALDALHIACAEMALSDVLLTTDDRMLAKAKEFRRSLHVRVESPIIWLMKVVTPRMTLAQIRERGVEALTKALGPAGMARFL